MKKEDKILELLRDKGVTYNQLESLLEAQVKLPSIMQKRQKRKFKIAIVSDTHLVDKVCALDELHTFYRLAHKEGVSAFIHAGDLLTGINVYRGQINDLLCFGVDEHLQYAIDHYPKAGDLKTYFISGNHDENYKKFGGVDIGMHISKARSDMVYLGMYDATLQLNGVRVGLHHGGGSPAYAESYKLQKYIEKIGSGKKPQLYVLGHYHGTFYMFYRNIHAFLPGCWQKPNDFSVRYGFPNMIGGWIVELWVADDDHNTIDRIRTEFVPFY